MRGLMPALAVALALAAPGAADEGKGKGKGHEKHGAKHAEEADEEGRGGMRFAGMDRNHDGVITRDEFYGVASTSYDPYDNSDRTYGAASYGSREQQFRDLDLNRDGYLTRREWRTDSATFNRADRNRDGVVSLDEFLRMN